LFALRKRFDTLNPEISIQGNIQVIARQDCFRTRNDNDGLRVIDDHRRASHDIANVEFAEQKHGRIAYPSNLVEIDAQPSLGLRLALDRSPRELRDLFVDGLAEGVVSFTDATDLL
jgi:hypothetical protein